MPGQLPDKKNVAKKRRENVTHIHQEFPRKFLILTASPLNEIILDPSVTVLESLAKLSDLPWRQGRVGVC